jgi:hypothetical protein
MWLILYWLIREDNFPGNQMPSMKEARSQKHFCPAFYKFRAYSNCRHQILNLLKDSVLMALFDHNDTNIFTGLEKASGE